MPVIVHYLDPDGERKTITNPTHEYIVEIKFGDAWTFDESFYRREEAELWAGEPNENTRIVEEPLTLMRELYDDTAEHHVNETGEPL